MDGHGRRTLGVVSTPNIETLFGGTWRGGSEGKWIDVIDPSDVRLVVARVPALTRTDIDEAFQAATAGARLWRATNALERAAVLGRAASLLRARQERIAIDLVREMGKTLAEARVEVTKTADFFDYYAGLARSPYGYLLHDGRVGVTTSVRYEPIGVVLAITPWNDPLLTPARKLAPALASGNSVVLKPATDTPLVAIHLTHALADADLPADVLSTVIGRGHDVSEALLAQSSLAAVTFTGSTETGLQLHRKLAGRNLRLQTEMGGKNASVVLEDADLELAAKTIGAASFGQAGQRCTATSRVIVDRHVHDELVDRLCIYARSLKLGPGVAEDTLLGPVINLGHRDSVLKHISHARDQGASVRTGGSAPAGATFEYGCFVEPTVVDDVARDMDIWKDEVFGPVIAVHTVDGFDEALDAANDSAYGLSAAIFTDSLTSAQRFIDLADVGQVSVNLPTSGWDVHQPFGGFRQSGSPFKEQGLEALRFYTRVKTSAVRIGSSGAVRAKA